MRAVVPLQCWQGHRLPQDGRQKALCLGANRVNHGCATPHVVQDNAEKLVEITPLCALDFYVHESCQRTGFGKQLFAFMLQVHAGSLMEPVTCVSCACLGGGRDPRQAGLRQAIHQISLISQPALRTDVVPAPGTATVSHAAIKVDHVQGNNFVVFRDYWSPSPSLPASKAVSRAGSGVVRMQSDPMMPLRRTDLMFDPTPPVLVAATPPQTRKTYMLPPPSTHGPTCVVTTGQCAQYLLRDSVCAPCSRRVCHALFHAAAGRISKDAVGGTVRRPGSQQASAAP